MKPKKIKKIATEDEEVAELAELPINTMNESVVPVCDATESSVLSNELDVESVGDENKKMRAPKDISLLQVIVPEPEKLTCAVHELYKGKAPRLIIRNLVLENFKSYAGRKEIGPFHKCFSSVVGPNGSGKSNVVDSLLFVFGFRTNKLRLNKISELIHNSHEFPDLEKATVEVHFCLIIDTDIDNGFEIVPGTDFVVSRTAHSNNKSNYYIDNVKCGPTEVRDKLMGYGIDLNNNRFLILQGEVEQISLMKPKAPNEHEEGILEYIEDIIGSNRYIPAIEESIRAVEKLNEERVLHLNRVRAVENEKANLEGAKIEAENYLEIQSKIFDAQANIIQIQTFNSSAGLNTLKSKHEICSKKLTEKKLALQKIENELNERDNITKKMKDERDTIVKDLNQRKSEFSVFERRKEKVKQDLNHTKTRGKKLESVRDTELKKIAEKKHCLDTLEAEIETSQTDLKELTVRHEEAEAKLEDIHKKLQDKTQDIRDQVDAKKKELVPKQKELSTLESELAVLNGELDILQETLKAPQREYSLAVEKFESLNEKVANSKEEMAEKKSNLKDLESRIQIATEELDKNQEEQSILQEKIKSLRQKISTVKSECEAVIGTSRLVTELSTFSNANGINFYGRLGDLGYIDPKYDIAVSTAASSLHNLVVESTSDAQKCVDYLKTKKLGRATFIILDQQNQAKSRMSQPIQVPKESLRLFDSVKVKDNRFLPAFYFALNDTLVVKSLDDATKIAYGKVSWRVVTLEGQLIESSGAMSGGGTTVFNGAMCLSESQIGGNRKTTGKEPISQKEIAKMEETMNEYERSSKNLLKTIAESEDEIDTLRKDTDTHVTDLEKLQMDIDSFIKQAEELKKQLPALKTQASKENSEVSNRLKEVQLSIARLMPSVEKSRKETESLSEDIKQLQNQIISAGGNPLKVQKAQLEDMAERIDALQGVITRANVQIKSCQKAIAKSEKEVATTQEELEQLIARNVELKKEKEEIATQGKEVAEWYNKFQELLAEKEDEIKQFEETFKEQKDGVERLREEEVDLQNKFEDLERELEEMRHFEETCKNHLETLSRKKSSLVQSLMVHLNESMNDSIITTTITSSSNDSSNNTTEKNTENEQLLALSPTLSLLAEKDLPNVSEKAMQKELDALQKKLADINPNMAAIAEYVAKGREHRGRLRELESVTNKRDEQQQIHENLRQKRLEEFMTGFSQINLKLKEMYRMITLGGDAELEFVDSLDPFSEGIVFSVRPPKKSWKNIANLSGGEKTLSSLALVFSLHHYKPTPLYFMDEIDAALDFKNVSIVAHYIKERTKNAQFIIISLRNNMFELGDRLVGIYKTQNCTKSVTIDPKSFVFRNENDGSNCI